MLGQYCSRQKRRSTPTNDGRRPNKHSNKTPLGRLYKLLSISPPLYIRHFFFVCTSICTDGPISNQLPSFLHPRCTFSSTLVHRLLLGFRMKRCSKEPDMSPIPRFPFQCYKSNIPPNRLCSMPSEIKKLSILKAFQAGKKFVIKCCSCRYISIAGY